MAETGHARNVEHFQQMISFCAGYGTDYDPTNAMIELAALNTALTDAQGSLDDVQAALHFGANDLDGTITGGGELTHSYSVESGGEVKMTKPEIIEMVHRAGLEERDVVYNQVARVAA